MISPLPNSSIREHKLLVLVPTRNRPRMARTAVVSVLNQAAGLPVHVVVSDNSSAADSERVREWHEELADARCSYLRPAQPLSMVDHWNWMVNQCLDTFSFSHATILTDRAIYRQGALRAMCDVMHHCNHDVIAYLGGDAIHDDRRPITLGFQRWTGDLRVVPTEHLRWQASRCVYGNEFPKMLNSISTRKLLEERRHLAGSVFPLTLSPDYGFGMDVLACRAEIAVLDMPITVGYGLSVSNGVQFLRGETGEARRSFEELASRGNGGIRLSSPIPEIVNVANGIVHEYVESTRRWPQAGFPALDHAAYLEYLGASLSCITNETLRQQYERLVLAHGWKPQRDRNALRKWVREQKCLRGLLTVVRSVRARMKPSPAVRFDSLEEALRYAYVYWPSRDGSGRFEVPDPAEVYGPAALPDFRE